MRVKYPANRSSLFWVWRGGTENVPTRHASEQSPKITLASNCVRGSSACQSDEALACEAWNPDLYPPDPPREVQAQNTKKSHSDGRFYIQVMRSRATRLLSADSMERTVRPGHQAAAVTRHYALNSTGPEHVQRGIVIDGMSHTHTGTRTSSTKSSLTCCRRRQGTHMAGSSVKMAPPNDRISLSLS